MEQENFVVPVEELTDHTEEENVHAAANAAVVAQAYIQIPDCVETA